MTERLRLLLPPPQCRWPGFSQTGPEAKLRGASASVFCIKNTAPIPMYAFVFENGGRTLIQKKFGERVEFCEFFVLEKIYHGIKREFNHIPVGGEI